MDKEEKEIEAPSKGGKGGVKKRNTSTPAAAGLAGPPSATPATPTPARAPKPAPPAPHPALVGSTNTTTTPAIPAPPATPPATHTGLPQQVRSYSYRSLLWYELYKIELSNDLNVGSPQVATQPPSFHVAQPAAPPVSTIPAVALSQTQPVKVNITNSYV